jgi:hypothetical protein
VCIGSPLALAPVRCRLPLLASDAAVAASAAANLLLPVTFGCWFLICCRGCAIFNLLFIFFFIFLTASG